VKFILDAGMSRWLVSSGLLLLDEESYAIPDTTAFETRWPEGSDLSLLLTGKKPYSTPDTATFETACGCFETG
jgi:hypothetical protein